MRRELGIKIYVGKKRRETRANKDVKMDRQGRERDRQRERGGEK